MTKHDFPNAKIDLDGIYCSPVLDDTRYGRHGGMVEKYEGYDWPEVVNRKIKTWVKEPGPDKWRRMNYKGEYLERNQFPLYSYTFNEGAFKRRTELCYVGGAVSFKGKLAEAIKVADMGRGGLIPYTVYGEDRKTPMPGNLYILNFDKPRLTMVPDECNHPLLRLSMPWKPGDGYIPEYVLYNAEDDQIAASRSAFEGADIWCDPQLEGFLFMKGHVVEAIRQSKTKIDFRFFRCRLVDQEPPSYV